MEYIPQIVVSVCASVLIAVLSLLTSSCIMRRLDYIFCSGCHKTMEVTR